ncbi:MAG: hypothetical protein Q4D29_06220 [Lachnospiraceae bacterium]|nr:hypothetical protein [Lachnospiraceae bacterium]
MKLEYAMAIAITPALCMLVGLVIGTLRYVKYGKEIRKRVEEEFKEKRAEGGINELFFKRPDKRVAYETFGRPLIISLIACFAVILTIFYLF